MTASQNTLAEWTQEVSDRFSISLVSQRPLIRGQVFIVTMTSQSWNGQLWRHRLFVYRPTNLDLSNASALMVLSSGRPLDDAPEDAEDHRFIGELAMLIPAAETSGTLVAVLSNTLHQPMFDGLIENDLLAHSFEQYLHEGIEEQPVVFPLVAAIRRAMDSLQHLARERFAHTVEFFTLSGLSKRGWGAWLAAGVDLRVKAVVPVMMDFIDIPSQVRHQREVWGDISPKLKPFEDRQIFARLDTPRGQALLDWIDPIRWPRCREVAKLLISASNDEYWPFGSAARMMPRLAEESWHSMIANARHGSLDLDAINGAIFAMHLHAADVESLPSVGCEVTTTSAKLRFDPLVESDHKPDWRLWSATMPTADFREAIWSRAALGQSQVAKIDTPTKGHLACFLESDFTGRAGAFSLTAAVHTPH
jgi:PhoPQ-activated pathogenicity-related protein